jgi:fumarate reductase subunit D
MDKESQKLIRWILKVTVGTLASICVVVVLALLVGIFMPNDLVDNQQIFAIIGPAFNTVIGAFVGLLGGLSLSGDSSKKQEEEAPVADEPFAD